ncbi:hypothetical protein COV12_03370 [Candidatus Woesearchaeota archaeon CG10_big_fil_rev_8_21_14_0_10_32_24]|nr:MAG: hypothetical protein COV12_03370 [Candidatus Woesearchaeota archaeon CG10_big_fil_rev_8_21_14_0_10_32_24]
MKYLKEKIASTTGSISGVASIFGSWQVCHNICLGLIGLLSVLGITVVGMPLAFFTTIVIPVWIIAVLLFSITLFFYFKKRCISKSLILINFGLITAGTPFQVVRSFNIIFWTVGGAIALTGLIILIKEKSITWNSKKTKNLLFYVPLIIIGIISIVLLINSVVIVLGQSTKNSSVIPSTGEEEGVLSSQEGYDTISTGTTNPGEVSVALTPKGIIKGSFVVDISANTHSVDLSQYDLSNLITLKYDHKEIYPKSAPTLSGHHAAGTIVFNLNQDIKTFTITIKGIPKIEERVFSW